MQRYLNTTQRTVVWFKKTYEAGDVVIKAPFQRNPVWSDRQKSALIDTILLEYPIPELYMQELTDASGDQKHVVVDGQQRIRAVLSFLAGEYELDDESPHWAGLSFDDLSPDDRKKVFEYNFIVRLLPEMPDEELRAIFQRINRNTVTLNLQELRHATYWGPFIKLMEELADLEFWSNAGLFSANDRRRMLDVEYVSELSVAVLNGLQNKKRNLEEFYQQYETNFEEAQHLRGIFVKVVGEIEQLLPDLAKTRWRKKSDFYTLFLKLARHAAALPLAAEARKSTSEVLLEIASTVDAVISEEVDTSSADADIQAYVKNVERAASDLGSRKAREVALDNKLLSVFPADG
ncbi:MAG: DUF262 domain-containing protein [Sterolibacteriaceae bacterium]|uniref:DUF262 domain-containing protein n=1 Tax=Candidatus Methylophosphatis roskildensis TaxID=2899263 RepID=A0A9D7E5C1_9PROT|nr:DUF262 domain-containing protein [Candidatus Methylophosphatis roskildensis]MBK7237031.1 DUF262 domain-containing protein [Sterolibacteriaceae bacterium]